MLLSQAEGFISDYAASEYFLFLDPSVKEKAEPILLAFFRYAQEEGVADMESLKARQVESVLMNRLPHLDLPAELKRNIPEVLDGFFTYLDRSGRFPAASAWQICVESLAGRFKDGIRPDGSVKGQTFRKNYTDVGRNDPCPCGSGKKFKKCCMALLQ